MASQYNISVLLVHLCPFPMFYARNIVPVFAFERFYFIYLTVILPGKLTENTFSFTATTWGTHEPIGSWG